MNLLNVPTSHQIEESTTGLDVWDLQVRTSKHTLTGVAVDVDFITLPEACDFAKLWAQRINGSIKIKKFYGWFQVVVPVQKVSY